jgi:aryl-alcohol dehydrogenase-like predicted oxidoreductase
MIEKIPFGRTGHESTRTIFGAAALGAMPQARADRVLDVLLEYGVNHIDVAASYGDAELRLAPWLASHPDTFFVASKTGERTRAGARDSIHRSLERLGVDRFDLIQFHNLADDAGWDTLFGPGGALEAAVEAREQGLVRFIGVTGHGTRIAEMHMRSLREFAFDSVLLPYNPAMMAESRYAEEFEALYAHCEQDQVAMQTIKSVARRRWRDDDTAPRYSWYEPIRDMDALRRAVSWVLRRKGLFVNTTSDATLLPEILKAASEMDGQVENLADQVEADVQNHGIEPLFIRGEQDGVR